MTEPTCFIAMPISTSAAEQERYGDADHWLHVMETLHEKALVAAGYKVIRPVSSGADLIHADIIQNLQTADLVLVDLSGHNPNVFFELGVRTALNLPISLVRDETTKLPFDTSGINTHPYDSKLLAWQLEEQRAKLAKHVIDSAKSCDGENPLWRKFGLTLRAEQATADESPLAARVDLIVDELSALRRRIDLEEARQLSSLPNLSPIYPGNSHRSRRAATDRTNFEEALRSHPELSGMNIEVWFDRDNGWSVVDLQAAGGIPERVYPLLADLAHRYNLQVSVRTEGRPVRLT